MRGYDVISEQIMCNLSNEIISMKISDLTVLWAKVIVVRYEWDENRIKMGNRLSA